MDTGKIDRKTGILVGILFLLAMACYMIGSEWVLNPAGGFRRQIGIVLEFVNSAAVVGIAALLFPVLRKGEERVAVSYAVARSIEAGLLLICSVCAYLFVSMGSEEALLSGVLLKFRELLFQMAMIVLGAGSIGFCRLLLRERLAPRGLAILGIAGYICLFVSGWFGFFGMEQVGMILYVPGAIFEIIFPIWLIVSGLQKSAKTNR
ncbi:MAG: DUF4386 domain-containing protein [Eubacteriales bacterium]